MCCCCWGSRESCVQVVGIYGIVESVHHIVVFVGFHWLATCDVDDCCCCMLSSSFHHHKNLLLFHFHSLLSGCCFLIRRCCPPLILCSLV
ncbi:unnamed protein product [Meloidogyne enterolobii]|uniref:Uncharacterized protein n=1 Tax=Meloidogyne enterolobii TaxID=390850 RepID=A0ACB0ZA33_MELEN